MAYPSLSERFFAKIRKNDSTGCWEWTAQRDRCGYGRISKNQKPAIAHRVSYEMHKGPIPHGAFIMHSCDNPACVNPDHLSPGSHKDNMADMALKGRSPRGAMHPRPCAVLTERDVIEIRAARGVTQKMLGAKYGVGQDQISRIRAGKRWGYVQENYI
jgi:hypothetical protein